MATIYDTGTITIDEDGATQVPLLAGAKYAMGVAGTFGGGTLSPGFIDGAANVVPLPLDDDHKGVTNPRTFAEAGMTVFPALSNVLVLDLDGSTDPDLTVTLTKLC
jgi:hypothetical protein